MDSPHQAEDRISPTGERPVDADKLDEQPLSSVKDRNVSVNPSPDAAVTGSLRNDSNHLRSSVAVGNGSIVHAVISHAPHEQAYNYGAYENNAGMWNGYPQYFSADNLQLVSPAVYDDNSSLMFHPDYGFNSQMTYGQYSPIATPLTPVMVDGQLYPAQQIPYSHYYPQAFPSAGVPHVSSAASVSQTEVLVPESVGHEGVNENMLFGPGSGYFVHYGSSSGADQFGNLGFYNFLGDFRFLEPFASQSNPLDANWPLSGLTAPAAYAQPINMLGSHDQHVQQISPPFRQPHGVGLVPDAYGTHYAPEGFVPAAKFGATSVSRSRAIDRNRLIVDKGRTRERDRDSVSIASDIHDVASDRNRGPRASKTKGKSTADKDLSSCMNKASLLGVDLHSYNHQDFSTDYANAKFFIIKSFSEDNVHKSIKYGVWASTPLGNRKLDAAYSEAKEIRGNCLVFLLFSVNASSQFCGVAEMVGPVDFEKNASYWQQDRWSGQFPVKWHIIKDVPNGQFRHILLENNEHKPVTHSRDTQEVKLEQGIQMLKIFKEYDALTSILDDFVYYDDRERTVQERKARQQTRSATESPASLSNVSISEISNCLAQNLQLKENTKEIQIDGNGSKQS